MSNVTENPLEGKEMKEELQRMMREVKVQLKGYSKNELIRMNVHLCVDNFFMKHELARLNAAATNATEETKNA